MFHSNRVMLHNVSFWCAGAALLLSVALVPQPAKANLLENGSFEFAGNQTILQETFWSLEASIPGWSVVGEYIELQKQGLYSTSDRAVDGIGWAELDIDTRTAANPDGSPTLVQTIDTIVGATYLFSGFYSPRPNVEWQDAAVFVNGEQEIQLGGRGSTFNDPHVTIDGVRAVNLAELPTPQFVHFSFEFTGTGLDEIGLGSLFTQNPIYDALGRIIGVQSPAGGGNLFDALSVVKIADPLNPPNPEPIPEPASGLLCLMGLGGLLSRRRSRKVNS